MKLVVRIMQECDGRYRAWCPALPGCVVRGSSREEVTRKMQEAIGGYLASLNVVIPGNLDREIQLA